MSLNKEQQLTWPPPYRLRKSARAKYIRLRITSLYGLELVVPHRFKQKDTLAILEEKKEWIQKTLLKINYVIPDNQAFTLPTEIHFKALQTTWLIRYVAAENETPHLQQTAANELVISGDLNNVTAIVKILRQWILQQAKQHLPDLLQTLSTVLQLPFNAVTIRAQRSCWGSCTHKKNISLNANLLFFPADLVRHVLIHELCHTQQLNHSSKFWKLMESFDFNYLSLRKQLRNAGIHIPQWLTLTDNISRY